MPNPTQGSPNVRDRLLQRAEREKKIAELQKDTLAAQSAMLEQMRPPGATAEKAAQEKVEPNNVEIEAHVMAMQALDKAAEAMARKIRDYKDFKRNQYGQIYPLKTLIIYNEQDATAVRQYRTFRLFLQTIADAYDQLLKASQRHPERQLEIVGAAIAPALLIKGVGVALQSAVNILSFFRADVQIAGVKTEVADMESALVASFAGHLHQGTTQDQFIDVYYPARFPLETSKHATGLVQRLTAIQEQRNQAKAKIGELEQQIKQNPSPDAQALLDDFKNTNAAYDKFIGALLTPDAKANTNTLLSLFRAATLQDKLDGGAHWIQLQVQKTGGNFLTRTGGLWKKSIWTCSGGAIVTYIIVDPDMTIVLSGKEVGFLEQRDIQDINR